ncbi:hypothetical protein PACTADRAFT_48930 [Pachysolen tannophilus NRRL Y-2460]|uniref:Uncharacterized protein n=1 Tax=Pachysolen tannophilus NRRL Y-2460 TaxID=669874 RepID=A0A1E4TZK1_PACTA|nr:hypothetical protein PACTADRAFT_48930 [Pachysolen tannophilus NRRL Y-2460]
MKASKKKSYSTSPSSPDASLSNTTATPKIKHSKKHRESSSSSNDGNMQHSSRIIVPHSDKRFNPRKQFRIINTNERTVKQNNFYFTKQKRMERQQKLNKENFDRLQQGLPLIEYDDLKSAEDHDDDNGLMDNTDDNNINDHRMIKEEDMDNSFEDSEDDMEHEDRGYDDDEHHRDYEEQRDSYDDDDNDDDDDDRSEEEYGFEQRAVDDHVTDNADTNQEQEHQHSDFGNNNRSSAVASLTAGGKEENISQPQQHPEQQQQAWNQQMHSYPYFWPPPPGHLMYPPPTPFTQFPYKEQNDNNVENKYYPQRQERQEQQRQQQQQQQQPQQPQQQQFPPYFPFPMMPQQQALPEFMLQHRQSSPNNNEEPENNNSNNFFPYRGMIPPQFPIHSQFSQPLPPPPPPPPPPAMMVNQDDNLEVDEKGKKKRKRKVTKKSKKSSRQTAATATGINEIPPFLQPPPPPPAATTYPEPRATTATAAAAVFLPEPELQKKEKQNLKLLLDASTKLPNVDMDFYKAVNSLDQMISQSKNKEAITKTNNAEQEDEFLSCNSSCSSFSSSDSDQDSETNIFAEEDNEGEEAEVNTTGNKTSKRKPSFEYLNYQNGDLEALYEQFNYMKFLTADGNVTEGQKNEKYDELLRKQSRSINFSAQDIIYVNGNNREKRRKILKNYLKDMNLFFNKNSEKLYRGKTKALESKCRDLTSPLNGAQGIVKTYPTLEGSNYNGLLFAKLKNYCEIRDYELLRLKYWRRYRRNENLNLYYDETLRIYNEMNFVIKERLERLRNFLIYQKHLLTNNLDKDYLDISTNKSSRLVKSFGHKYVEENNNADFEEVVESDSNRKLSSASASSSSGVVPPDFSPNHQSDSMVLLSASNNKDSSSSDTDLTSTSASGLTSGNSANYDITKRKRKQQQAQQQAQQQQNKKQKLEKQSNSELRKNSAINKKLSASHDQQQSAQRKLASAIELSILDDYGALITPEEFSVLTSDDSKIYQNVVKFMRHQDNYVKSTSSVNTRSTTSNLNNMSGIGGSGGSNSSSIIGGSGMGSGIGGIGSGTTVNAMSVVAALGGDTNSITNIISGSSTRNTLSSRTIRDNLDKNNIGNSGRENAQQLAKIMRHYQPPTSLKNDEIIEDFDLMGKDHSKWSNYHK